MYPYIIVFFLLLSSDYISKKYVNFICFFILFIFMGMRFYIGVDFTWYYGLAERNDLFLIPIFSSLNDYSVHMNIAKDSLYNYYLYRYLALEIFNKILYKIVWILKKPQLIIFIYSFLVLFFLKISMKKIDKKYIKYIWIFFFCFSDFFLLDCNMIRQAVAVSIGFYSLDFIIKKQKIKFMLCVFLAMSFHTSSIIITSFYIIYHFFPKLNKYILLLIYLFSFCGKNILFLLIKKSFLPTKYLGYLEPNFLGGKKMFLLFIIIGILIILFIDKIDKKKYKIALIVIVGCCLNILLKGTGYLGIRIRIYYFIYILYLIPDYINVIYRFFYTKYIYIILCLLLLLLTLINDMKAEESQYVPYKTFINKNID